MKFNLCAIIIFCVLYILLLYMIKRVSYGVDDLESNLKQYHDSSREKTLKKTIPDESKSNPDEEEQHAEDRSKHKENSIHYLGRSAWDMEQEARRNHLRSECEYYSRITSQIPTLDELISMPRKLLSNIMVDDKNKVLYCRIPKVAGTQWTLIMKALNEQNVFNSAEETPPNEAYYSPGIIPLSSETISREDILERLKFYKKFIIVRHPLERLLSAYIDNFGSNSTEFRLKYAEKIMRFVRRTSNVPYSGEGLQFNEFLSYIISMNQAFLHENWKPYLHLCYPCTIFYDYIGKYATLEDDSNKILEEINAPPNMAFPTFQPSRTSEILLALLPSIPEEILHKLYKKYEADLTLFEYEPIKYTENDYL